MASESREFEFHSGSTEYDMDIGDEYDSDDEPQPMVYGFDQCPEWLRKPKNIDKNQSVSSADSENSDDNRTMMVNDGLMVYR